MADTDVFHDAESDEELLGNDPDTTFADEYDLPELEGSLQNLVEQESLRWIFVGGKGGVGKTTTSCSIGVRISLSRPDERVLIVSTDPAHNVSDAFKQKFGKDPVLVNGFTNLYCMEIDPSASSAFAQSLGGNSSMSASEIDEATGGMHKMFKEIVGAVPGIDEAMSFAELMKQVQKMDYCTVIFDTAPTGHTLRLLSFPTVMEKAISKILELKSKFSSMFDGVSRLFGANMADALSSQSGQLVSRIEEMRSIIDRVDKQFRDAERTTFVCVAIPEFLSLYETERLVQELAKYEIDAHNVVINQVLIPKDWEYTKIISPSWADKACNARIKMQRKYIDQFHDLYEDFHVVTVPLLNIEVRGVDLLKVFGKHLFQRDV